MPAPAIPSSVRPAPWLELIRAEYLDVPGLNLTRDQVRRLWNLDEETCDAVLQALIDGEFLRRTPTGSYVRADCGVC